MQKYKYSTCVNWYVLRAASFTDLVVIELWRTAAKACGLQSLAASFSQVRDLRLEG